MIGDFVRARAFDSFIEHTNIEILYTTFQRNKITVLFFLICFWYYLYTEHISPTVFYTFIT